MTARIDEEIDATFDELGDREELAPLVGRRERRRTSSLADAGASRRRSVAASAPTATSTSARCCGSGDDWLVIDFEGEPTRGVASAAAEDACRCATSPGMLRSFSYLAAHARPRRAPRSPTWEEEARDAVPRRLPRRRPRRRCSRRRPGGAGPASSAMFELEKAFYELRYELDHRPDWVDIPVRSIVDAPRRADAVMTGTLAPAVEHDLDRLRRALAPRPALAPRHPSASGRRRRRARVPAGIARRRRVVVDGENHQMTERRSRAACSSSCSPTRRDRRATGCARRRTDVASTTRTAFLPSLGDLDLHLLGEGRHRELGRVLGAHPRASSTACDGDVVRGVGARRRAASASSATSTGGTTATAADALARAARGCGSCSCPASSPAIATSSRSTAPTAALRLHADPRGRADRGPARDRVGRVRGRTTAGSDDDWMARRADAARPAAARCRSTRCTRARGAPGARLARPRRAARRLRHRPRASPTSSSCP